MKLVSIVPVIFVSSLVACSAPEDLGSSTGTAQTSGNASGTTRGTSTSGGSNTTSSGGVSAGSSATDTGGSGVTSSGTNGNTAGSSASATGTGGSDTSSNTTGGTATGTDTGGPTTGGVSTGTSGTSTGGPDAGTGGRPDSGTGSTGTTGTTGRTSTTGSTTGGVTGGTTGGGGDLSAVAKPIDGAMLLGPCLQDSQAAVCQTIRGACPPANTQDRALSGVLTTDKTITLGGTMGQSYTITLHVQGEVESKKYSNCTDQNSSLTSPKADGFCKPTGGTIVPDQTNAYNVYMLRVTNPGATTHTDYPLNSLEPPGVSNHTTYGIDYTAQIQAQGGATVRLIAADSNCSMIKNCGPTVNDGNTCAAPIILQNVEPTAISSNPSFDFTKAYNGQWIVLTVKNVTSP